MLFFFLFKIEHVQMKHVSCSMLEGTVLLNNFHVCISFYFF